MDQTMIEALSISVAPSAFDAQHAFDFGLQLRLVAFETPEDAETVPVHLGEKLSAPQARIEGEVGCQVAVLLTQPCDEKTNVAHLARVFELVRVGLPAGNRPHHPLAKCWSSRGRNQHRAQHTETPIDRACARRRDWRTSEAPRHPTPSPPRPGETLHNGGNPALPYVPSVFDVVHDHGGSTALYASKGKFALFDISWNEVHGAPDTVGSDQGRDKIDRFVIEPDTGRLTDTAIAALRSAAPRFAFLHLADPDAAGHGIGWGTPTWLAAVAHVDAQIGKVLDAVGAEPRLRDSTVVIVTTDHGGFGNSHFDIANPLIHTIPFFVWGRRIERGVDAYKAFVRRHDPGAARPDFTAADQPLRNGDAGNLALDLLGLPAIPGSTMRDAGLSLTRCPTTKP